MPDTQYSPLSFIFDSRGIVASPATDQAPPHTYLSLLNAEERVERAMSSRYGSIIQNRDADGTPGGVNYLLPNPIVSLSRLVYGSQPWRYAADSAGILYRRMGDSQGPYSQIETGLSGSPFSSAVNTCYESSVPYLFIADAALMLKDSGTGSPTRIGIVPPALTANMTPFAPQTLLIDGFNSSLGGYSLTNVSAWASNPIGTVTTSGGVEMVNNFIHYDTAASGLNTAFGGALAMPSAGVATLALIFDIYGPPSPSQFSAVGVTGTLPVTLNNFALNAYTGTVQANTTATVGKTVSLDLSQNNQVTDDDLICLCLAVSDPNAVQQINVQFDVNNSGFNNAYFTKSISPAYYQPGISNLDSPYETTANQVYAIASGLIFGEDSDVALKPPNQGTGPVNIINTPSQVQQLQPATMGTGSGDPATSNGSWMTIYMRRGDFLPVGTAGEQNQDWASITGWQIQIVTNNNGSISFGVNGLYLQWGSGPSSFGGIGYDYRYTYYNFQTGTESNACPYQSFSDKYGYVASLAPLVVLRQTIAVTGQYSSDPQVTHVRLYRRGGTYGGNWYLLDQIPNVTGTGAFTYDDILPDLALEQTDTLVLDNDVPVTSTLQTPIYQTLTAPTIGPGNSPYSQFVPQAITVTGSPTFLSNQIVDIGTPQNLEQVTVITGGVGTFTAILRLQHATGEPVQAFSVPAQPVDLVELAYGQLWWAGDPNNPHYLYYSKPGYPENCGPQNYIQVSSPSDPIMGVINFRGTLFAATLTTWYQIVGGNTPYAQPTGSKHGLVAKHGYTQTESAIWYQAVDGIRQFRGTDGAYMSLPIEWIFRQVPQAYTPIPLANLNSLSTVTMAFQNNFVYIVYPNQNGSNDRLAWSTSYNRWRNDSVNATTIFFEQDTNTLLYAKLITAGAQTGYAIVQDRVGDYDDGGWVAGVLTETSIAVEVQIPFQDVGRPHFPKQWNTVEVDANTQGQDLAVLLYTDENPVPLNIGTVNTSTRQKVQLAINAGLGVEAYRLSPAYQISVTSAPVVYQMDIYSAQLAAYRSTFDTYWIKFGFDESKLIKEGYFDYTSTADVVVSLYYDGFTGPYYTLTLPANPNRAAEPIRERFPAIKLRQFRMVATSTESYQLWSSPSVYWKACKVGSGYARMDLTT